MRKRQPNLPVKTKKNMDTQLEIQIKERFAQLPEDIKNAIQSNALEENLQHIGEMHRLHIDQMGILGDEVRLVMLGFADPNEFAATLTAQAQIPAEQAEKLASEIADRIFTPIRESMQKFMEEREADEEAKTIATLANTPMKIEKIGLPEVIAPENITAKKPLLPMAETMLSQSTSTIQARPMPQTNAQPRPYKTDPYLEPTE
jgi:hypothetical protein